MLNKNKCITKILSDLPADEDAFGSHKRVAEAIANLICEEDGGKAIALKGALGVGKSTVVTLLKKELDSDKSTGVFVFDAWTHRGDPLRVVFLEELIKFLDSSSKKWVAKKSWDDKLLEIKRLKEVSDTIATPKVTKMGLLLALSILLLPVGYIFFDKFLDKRNAELFGVYFGIWGVIFSFLPFIVVLSAMLIWLTGYIGYKFFNKKKPEVNFEDIALWFVHKDKETITTSTIKTPEPTSVEFSKIFDGVIQEALSESKRKLIIVIDNLDRVDEEDALSIWATMRAFFGDQAWLKRF
jgi:energy-coupling factor transporter ATP-binding protein EcfA2